MSLRLIIGATLVVIALTTLLFFHSRGKQAMERSYSWPDKVYSLTIRNDSRLGFSVKSNTRKSIQTTIPKNGFLHFSVGTPDDTWSAEQEPLSLKLTMKKRAEEILWQRDLYPASRKQDRGWQEISLDLTKHQNKQVELILHSSSPASGGQSFYLSKLRFLNPEFEQQKMNVLLISIDTLRRDHMSLYGYGRKTTPALDQLAARSSVFERAYSSAPLTLRSLR